MNAQLLELLGMEDKRKENPVKTLDMKREKRQKKDKKKRRPNKGGAK